MPIWFAFCFCGGRVRLSGAYRPFARDPCREKSFFGVGICSHRSDCLLRSAETPRGRVVRGAPVRSVRHPDALCRHCPTALRAAFPAGDVASSILLHALPRKVFTRSFRQLFLAKSLIGCAWLGAVMEGSSGMVNYFTGADRVGSFVFVSSWGINRVWRRA